MNWEAVCWAIALSAAFTLWIVCALARCSQCGAYKETDTCVNCPPAGPETLNP